MDERHSCHYQQENSREIFQDRCRALEMELRRKNNTIDQLRNEILRSNQKTNLPTSVTFPSEPSLVCSNSKRSNLNKNWNFLTKDREIAKLKALVFQKDNEVIAMSTANKNTLIQMEERMERERKVSDEHKQLLLTNERTKFEEEKSRLLKNFEDQLKLEQERCQRLEQQLYDARMQSSEAQLMLKESGRERINAVYGTKEQCRKEFQDEITRLRNQFQLEKDIEFSRFQERIRQLENELDRMTTENGDVILRQQEIFISLEASEKTCVRSIHDLIKKLLMTINNSSENFSSIPNVSSFTYDQKSIIERIPTRNLLKFLQDTIDDVRNFIVDQKIEVESKFKYLNKSKILTDRNTDFSNRIRRSHSSRDSQLKYEKENENYFRDVDRLSANSQNSFQLSSEQNNTIDNLVQKLEDHIASELERLTKERLTLNDSNNQNEQLTSIKLEPPRKIKFQPISSIIGGEDEQDQLIRHLQDRINDLRDDNTRLRESQQSRTNLLTNDRLTSQDNENRFSSTSIT